MHATSLRVIRFYHNYLPHKHLWLFRIVEIGGWDCRLYIVDCILGVCGKLGSFREIEARGNRHEGGWMRLGSFRIFGSVGRWGGANWVRFVYLPGGDWVRFAEIGVGGTLWYAGIGFVLHFLAAGVVDWVRFAFLAWGGVAVAVNWVRFVFFGLWGDPRLKDRG